MRESGDKVRGETHSSHAALGFVAKTALALALALAVATAARLHDE